MRIPDSASILSLRLCFVKTYCIVIPPVVGLGLGRVRLGLGLENDMINYFVPIPTPYPQYCLDPPSHHHHYPIPAITVTIPIILSPPHQASPNSCILSTIACLLYTAVSRVTMNNTVDLGIKALSAVRVVCSH